MAIHPLAERDQAAQGDDSSSHLSALSDAAPALANDSGQGLALFVLFTVAVLVVTGAVGFLALLTSWWVLGVVFGVHVLVTVIVGTAVFSVLGGRKPRPDVERRLQRGGTPSPEEAVPSPARPGQASPIAA